jgi:hypothetical protein
MPRGRPERGSKRRKRKGEQKLDLTSKRTGEEKRRSEEKGERDRQ